MLLIAAAAGAQPGDSPFDADWRWVDFGPEDGLPGGTVLDLVVADGTVWVWTAAGVAWYDGYRWQPAVLAPEVDPRSVTSLSVTLDGRIVVVAAHRLFEQIGGRFAEIELDGLDPGQSVETAVAHPDGGLALATLSLPGDQQIHHLTAAGIERIDDGRRPETPRSLWLTRGGRLWAAFQDGLAVRQDGRWRTLLPGSDPATRLVETASGTVYVARNDPLRRRTLTRIDPDGRTTALTSEGGHWLRSGDVTADGRLGVFLYDTGDVRVLDGGGFSELSHPDIRWASANFVRFAGTSGDADLWLGTPAGLSLYRRSLQRWSAIRQPFPSERNRVNALLVDRSGLLWQATASGLGVHAPPRPMEWRTDILGLSTVPTTALAEDAEGAIWIGSGASFFGALRFLDGEWTHVGDSQGLTGGRVHRIVAGREGTLWFATLGKDPREGAGLYRRRPDGSVEAWSEAHGLPEAAAFDVLDLGDEVWFGTEAGLHRERDGRLTEWRDGLEAAYGFRGAFAIARDPAGRIWFSGHPEGMGGLGYVDRDDRLVWVDPPGGDLGRRVWSLTVDSGGILWAGSAAGVLRHSDDRWSLFGPETGLMAQSVWPVVPQESQVLVGTLGSGVRILQRAEETAPPPRLQVETPLVDGRAVYLQWRATDFRGGLRPAQVETRHRVDDGAWSVWGHQRELTLTGLSSGEHLVHFEAKGLFGQVAPQPTTVRAMVPWPLLLRPVFAGPLAALVAALLGLGSYTYRRRLVEERSRRTDVQRLRTLIESAPEAIGIYDVRAQRFVELNTNASRMFGRSREELLAIDPLKLLPKVLPDGRPTREAVEAAMAKALDGEQVRVDDWEVLGAPPEGSDTPEPIPCAVRITRLPAVDEDLLRVSALDIRQQLRAARERQELEDRLRQTQKLEALGKLTGGIAHDFNNLLTVVIGNLDLLAESQTGDDRRLADNARSSAQQGADLVRRLLAFSRSQPLAPRRVDLGETLPKVAGLLRRTLPETITVVVEVEDRIPQVTVDPGGLENALLNLAINSRDAMPSGGKLTLRAARQRLDDVAAAVLEEIEPGTYVALSVVDDGSGMSPAVAGSAFDPFFTTKEVGAGTGLGLSMVYGFARQSRGAVQLESKPGVGTEVRLLLPLATGESPIDPEPEPGGQVQRGRGERLLVVEDDDSVRQVLELMLDELGYDVVSVADARQALELLRSHATFDLVLSDVVLPGGMTGPELGKVAAELRPGLPFLYASGYAGGKALDSASDWATIEIVPKPIDRADLSRRLRRRLAQVELPHAK